MSISNELLPAKYRDMIRSYICTLGLDSISCEKKEMKKKDQEKLLHEFVFGNQKEKPSNVDLLLEGVGSYADMWEPAFVPTTSKDGKKEDVEQRQLKPDLIQCYDRVFLVGKNILSSDLKRMNRSGKPTLPTKRTCFGWAQEGAKQFRRANAFASHWWDSVQKEPRKDKGASGLTKDDVKQKVIDAMYIYSKKSNCNDDSDDDVDESRVDIESDTENKKSNEDSENENENKKDKDDKQIESCNDGDKAPPGWAWKGAITWFRHGILQDDKEKRLLLCETGK